MILLGTNICKKTSTQVIKEWKVGWLPIPPQEHSIKKKIIKHIKIPIIESNTREAGGVGITKNPSLHVYNNGTNRNCLKRLFWKSGVSIGKFS